MAQSLPNCIPAPPWWQLIQWVADPLGFQDKYSQANGDWFTMRLGGLGEVVLLGNPQAIQADAGFTSWAEQAV